MQEDFITRAVDLLQADGLGMPAAAEEVDARAMAVLGVATGILQPRIGREGVLQMVGEALDAGSLVRGCKIPDAVAHTPAERLAVALLDLLRGHDPSRPAEAVAGHDDAGAMILAGAAFLQERHGSAHAAGYMANLLRTLQEAVAAGEEPVSAPAKVAPIMPPPAGIRAAAPNPRAGLTLSGRVNVMREFLRGSTQADARDDALASLMASALFLRDRFGELYAVGALRQVESTVSQAAMLDRWQPEGAAAN